VRDGQFLRKVFKGYRQLVKSIIVHAMHSLMSYHQVISIKST